MRFLNLLITAALTLTTSMAVNAQTYPQRPIKIIVAYAAGQGTDIATRYLAAQMSTDLGQPIVIENKAGAGGNLGTDLARQAAPDGYTLTMGTNATHVLNQFLYARLPFDPSQDFEPIALVGTFPMVIAVSATSPLTSAAELVNLAQRSPRSADIAMPSTTARLVVELLKDRTSVPLFGIPYKGSANAMSDLLGGQVPAIVDTPTALRPMLASGKLRALAVTSAQPSGLMPGVKTVAEQGFKDFEVVAWNALYAPKGTPQDIVTKLNASLNKVLAQPETRQRLLDLGFDPAGGSPARLAAFAVNERRKWEPVIKRAGIQVD
ncbi:Bug family tripartite tricarboxylate transporter substrate binding protein [Hydrogenophaga sp.]|uniref:Bug family tripartite tricarboxylate transporter substrate binding protein n=1 Tax=Hydrogenophaga sp. TaxID=1904254 RepID=UPI002FC9B747